ncbi:DUF4190 domain-containing protein [Streptomyces sp. TLI_171]|uniref:DUF4190 domain-containing protein n=1 Tax=Streptomyces sp. TLI_171 TaxID=1938859 RepID=UPI000C17DD65|nr:DUF4190 domain-containing protein [Streptomyces sp. TLI_171]RKE21747.1 uncharacterized protein DUF4190 [Streptomyces sp. TLI_171]
MSLSRESAQEQEQEPGSGPGAGPPPAYAEYPNLVQPAAADVRNTLAIAAMVTGLLFFVGFVGIALGVAALRQIRRTGERGRAMAITGIVGGAVWPVILIGTLIAPSPDQQDLDRYGNPVPAASRLYGTPLPSTRPDARLELAQGDCFKELNGNPATVTGCAKEHQGEVYWTGESDTLGSAAPSEAQIEAEARRLCLEHLDGYVLDTWALPATVSLDHAAPGARSWQDPSGRRFVCFLSGEGKPLIGSLRTDLGKLTQDQKQLLTATGRFGRMWYRKPPGIRGVADDPTGYRTWANFLSIGANAQATDLLAGVWQPAQQADVDRLVAESRTAADHFAAAGRAADLGSLAQELELGFQHIGEEQVDRLRQSLGLPAGAPNSDWRPAAVTV